MRQDSSPLVMAGQVMSGQDRSDKVRTDQCGSGQDHKNNLKQAGLELGLTQAETVSLINPNFKTI